MPTPMPAQAPSVAAHREPAERGQRDASTARRIPHKFAEGLPARPTGAAGSGPRSSPVRVPSLARRDEQRRRPATPTQRSRSGREAAAAEVDRAPCLAARPIGTVRRCRSEYQTSISSASAARASSRIMSHRAAAGCLQLRVSETALGQRRVDVDDLADLSGTAREHDDRMAETHGLGQVVGDIDRGERRRASKGRRDRPSAVSRVWLSSADSGSSISMTAGLTASARAMATRCFMPPESCRAAPCEKSVSLVRASTSAMIRLRPRAPAQPVIFQHQADVAFAPCATAAGRNPGRCRSAG